MTAAFRHSIGVLFFATAHAAYGFGPDERVINNPSAKHHGAVGNPKAVANLPQHVPSQEGRLTLWADFASTVAGGVPLFLVNQSNEEKKFYSQDSDIHIVLEFKKEDGSWKRAQARLSSWCGNSYYPVTLPARHYFEFKGYRAAKGTVRTVRYANSAEGIYSNEGEGVIPLEDLQAVSLDYITAAEIPFSLWSSIQFQEDGPLPTLPSLAERAEGIRTLVWLPRNEPLVNHMRAFQHRLKSLQASSDRDKALQAIDEFFAKLDAPKPNRTELMRLCIARLSGSAEASPALTSQIAWRLLQNPDAIELPPESFKGIIGPAVEKLTQAEANGDVDVGSAAMVLASGRIIDTLVSDEELEQWLVSRSAQLRNIGALALARRSKFQRLVDIGWQRPGPEQITILRALTRLDYLPDGLLGKNTVPRLADDLTDEPAFWRHCVTKMPLGTARALWSYSFAEEGSPFGLLIHDPLHDFFKAEAESSFETELSGERADDLTLALYFLASWGLQQDNQVMRDLLKHGGYILQKSWRGDNQTEQIVTRRYPVRRTAKAELLRRGQPISEMVIEEEVISITKDSPSSSSSKIPLPQVRKRRELIPAPVDK
jgi:hypothetical protein